MVYKCVYLYQYKTVLFLALLQLLDEDDDSLIMYRFQMGE